MIAKVFNTFVESLDDMKNLTLLLIFCTLSFYSFSQEPLNKTDAQGLKTGKWIGRYPGGALKYEGSFVRDKPSGEWKRYHESGKLKAIMNYRPNSERVFASLSDEEGKLYAKGVFEGTLRDSTWNFYSGDLLLMTENYHLGKREGKAVGFYPNGKIKYEKWRKDDLLDGNAVEYDPTGIKRREIFYREDKKEGVALFYDENGVRSMEGGYKDDLSDGTWKIFDKEGKLKYQIKYEKGEILDKGALDTLQINEFKKYDKVKGKIPEPKANETGFP